MKASYVLILCLPEPQAIPIGRQPPVYFPSGFYAYVGSAMGGLEARINRHLKPYKKLHWHIDHLLQKASITEIIMAGNGNKFECDLARALNRQFECIRGFGASDCRCPGHLFRADDRSQLEGAVLAALDSMVLTPQRINLVKNHG